VFALVDLDDDGSVLGEDDALAWTAALFPKRPPLKCVRPERPEPMWPVSGIIQAFDLRAAPQRIDVGFPEHGN
jgi:hypothetical protein